MMSTNMAIPFTDEPAPEVSHRHDRWKVVYRDASFPLSEYGDDLTVSQQCVDDPYGFNAVVVIGDSSFPLWRHLPFPIPFTDNRALPELPHGTIDESQNHRQDVDESQIPRQDVDVSRAVPQLSSPTVSPSMRASAGGLAAALFSPNTTDGVEPLAVSVETGQACEIVQPMESVEEEDEDVQQRGGRRDGKKRRKKSQRHKRPR